MKTKTTQWLTIAVFFSILLGLVEGCSKKKEQKPTETRPAQKRLDDATEDL